MSIYDADPFGNREFYSMLFGEETVNVTTGENTTNEKAARALFPRVNFREVEDAEMVVECLRQAAIKMGKKAAHNLQISVLHSTITIAGITAVVFDGAGNSADINTVIKEQTTALTQLLDMVEAVTGQLATMYGTPDEDNAKYISGLLEFVTETRDFNDALMIAAELSTEGR